MSVDQLDASTNGTMLVRTDRNNHSILDLDVPMCRNRSVLHVDDGDVSNHYPWGRSLSSVNLGRAKINNRGA